MLATGAAECVADVKSQAERTDLAKNPDRINALRVSPAVIAKMRKKIESSLNRAYDVGRFQAVRAVEGSIKKSRDAVSDDEGDTS